MALTNAYTQVNKQIPDLFKKISEGEAPPQFNQQYLKDLGYRSSNHRMFIPLLKALGFLSNDGKPTPRYHDYRNGAMSRKVMGDALRDAYADIFVLKAKPTDADKPLIQGKFKSAHNVSDNLARLMTATFYSLLVIADLSAQSGASGKQVEKEKSEQDQSQDRDKDKDKKEVTRSHPSLHYNIQIHLPATKDIEVFNAIFKSLKEHLLE